MAVRGVDVSYETIRCWTIKFGPLIARRLIARRLKKRRWPPTPRWHMDEEVCNIGGKRVFLWRAVDEEGEVLDVLVQRRRDKGAALKLLRHPLHNQPVEPQTIVTDGLASYGAALDLRVLSVQRELVSTEGSPGRGGEPYVASVCHSARAAERWALYVSLLMRWRS